MARPQLVGAALALATLLPSQSRVSVDYNDGAVCNPPTLAFPFYTPGAGSAQQTVRVQFWCPPTFTGLPQRPMLCSKIGVQIAGRAVYSTFDIRAGASPVNQLSTAWRTNLPDQRVQTRLNGKPLPGGMTGGNPSNLWVELELEYPFYFQSGQGVVLDLTTKIAIPGQYSSSCIGTNIQRVVDSNYTGGPVAPSVRPTGGLKFRMVFEPLGAVPFGTGCAGANASVPTLGSVGTSQLGNSMFRITLANALGGAPTTLILGGSRSEYRSSPLPVGFGADCSLRAAPDLLIPFMAQGSGAGNGTANATIPIPNTPVLLGSVVYSQWAQVDAASSASLPLTFSGGGAIVIHR